MAMLMSLGPSVALAQTGSAPADTGLSAIAQAAAQRGVSTCLANIDKLAKNLAASHDIGVYLFNKLDDADKNLFSISMELTPSPSGGPLYVSASFMPAANGTCQVMLESTISWASGCVEVGLAYPGYKVVGQLLGAIKTLAAEGPERLFLMPTFSGCLSIEKSIYY